MLSYKVVSSFRAFLPHIRATAPARSMLYLALRRTTVSLAETASLVEPPEKATESNKPTPKYAQEEKSHMTPFFIW